ncbi:MAG: hypothetical protein KGH88_04140 [Thaumarchaeota archaeon]|nr:hypothetical protein [Nitrososphaerota archaeon]
MKTLHLSIIIAAGMGVAAVFGGIILFSPHMFSFGSQNTSDGSQLAFAVSINSTRIKTGQSMGMDISLTNPSSTTLVVNPQHNWPLKKWSIGPCLFHLPFGMTLMQGDYTLDNMSQGQRLQLYQSGVYMCKTIGIVDYVFEPSSSKATIETYNSTNYPVNMQYHIGFNGYYEGQKFRPLTEGIYTVIGEDRWGHILVNHFTVNNTD